MADHTSLPDPSWSLPEIFHRHATTGPETPVLFELSRASDRTLRPRPITHQALLTQARHAAAHLEAAGVAHGQPVLLLVERHGHFMAWFLGAMALGAIPVPLPPPSNMGLPESFRERIESVHADASPTAIVSDRAQKTQTLVSDAEETPWLDTLLAEETAEPSLFDLIRPLQDIAYLQYTSGSTGSPKGVIVTHRNLVANLRASALAAHFTSQDRCVTWLPLYHDMGLIGGPLLGIFLHAPPYLMRPVEFVMDPISWLRALSEFQATFTTAPNFAYSIAAHKLPDHTLQDLNFRHLRLAFNGGEPIDHRTVKRFLRRFSSLRFGRETLYPVYGLAEATLAVSFPDPTDPPRFDRVDRDLLSTENVATKVPESHPKAVTFVSVGRSVPDHELRIRDVDTGLLLPDRHVGEICFAGPSTSPGYYGRPPRDSDEIHTGDLGYLVDGELFVVDRLKDLIILGGRNFVPSDIERHLTGIDGLRRGALSAVALPGEHGTDALHIIAEVAPRPGRPLSDIEAQIRRTVHKAFQIGVAEVHLVPPNSLPKTSSGKIQRSKIRSLLLDSAFSSMHATRTRLSASGKDLQKRFLRWLATRS